MLDSFFDELEKIAVAGTQIIPAAAKRKGWKKVAPWLAAVAAGGFGTAAMQDAAKKYQVGAQVLEQQGQ